MANRISHFDPEKSRSQKEWDEQGRSALESLLASQQTLSFPPEQSPTLSVILVFFNKAHLSFLCLDALSSAIRIPYEVVIVDNASTDSTSELLKRCLNATIIRNQLNIGFGEACMQAAQQARGAYLLFLNNDAAIRWGSVEAALDNFKQPSIGAVGGKILLADGRLQEAGSILWSDGSALGYGRGADPDASPYRFRRPTDYCSGAFLFTPRTLFLQLGGFDPIYAPAYYEDTDYCMRLWQAGFTVLYEPRAILHHYESASSGGNDAARPQMAEKQRVFVARWRSLLDSQYERSEEDILRARTARRATGLRILYIDDCIPHRSLGSGYPRSNDILRALAKQGHIVTAVPFFNRFQNIEAEYRDLPHSVEFFDYRSETADEDDLSNFFDHRSGRRELFQQYVSIADVIWVSRPHNLVRFLDHLVERGETSARIVFDAEALFNDRERLSIAFSRRYVAPKILEVRRRLELDLAHVADAVTVVSERDGEQFRAAAVSNVKLLGHCLEACPTMQPREHRSNILSIGAVPGPDTPNSDAMRFFCREAWKEIHEATGSRLVIAGRGTDYYLHDLASDSITVAGSVIDLYPVYQQARLVVIPTRFAAGIPYKAHEAAAFGVPMVVSRLIATQLGWEHEVDLLIAEDASDFSRQCIRLHEDAELWRRLRTNALTRIICDYSRETFDAAVADVLQSALASGSSGRLAR